MFHQWQNNISESWESIRLNPMRNVLTGFGVAWGVFILVILLGAGKGLQEGVMRIFGDYAQNSMWVYGGMSSAVGQGQTEGRVIQFPYNYLDKLPRIYPEIKAISPEINVGRQVVEVEKNNGSFDLKAVMPSYFQIKTVELKEGRQLHVLDEKQERKVVVLGDKLVDELWGDVSPIGKSIEIANTWFTVVGVLNSGLFSGKDMAKSIFMPVSTCRKTLKNPGYLSAFGIVLHDGTDAKKFEDHLTNYLARQLLFSPDDKKAIYIFNQEEMVKSFSKLFAGINAFLWFMGITLLISGMVSIGNIMLVIVKERTKEIGIRMALGARKTDVVGMVLSESLLITLMAGFVGLFLGGGFISIINWAFFSSPEDDALFQQMKFSFGIGVVAILSLMLAGIAAGLIPARKAANIQPVEALNYDAN